MRSVEGLAMLNRVSLWRALELAMLNRVSLWRALELATSARRAIASSPKVVTSVSTWAAELLFWCSMRWS